MCAATGSVVFLQCRRSGVDQITLDGCPAGRVIYIVSAIVGYSKNITWNHFQCRIGKNVSCQGLTYHRQIMQCNGRPNCSFSRGVFSQRCSRWQHQVNFIKIKYICLKGKSIMFRDSDFRNHTLKDSNAVNVCIKARSHQSD